MPKISGIFVVFKDWYDNQVLVFLNKNRKKVPSGLGTNSDVKQKRVEALPLGESMKPEATHFQWVVVHTSKTNKT